MTKDLVEYFRWKQLYRGQLRWGGRWKENVPSQVTIKATHLLQVTLNRFS